MIPFVNITAQREAYRHELELAEKNVFESGCYIGGPEVEALEKELTEFCKMQTKDMEQLSNLQVIPCASGTDALTLALLAIGIKPGDQVIVPDFTFIAPAECTAALGAVPVFTDINPHTLQIDPEDVLQKITPKTKGIIAVNLFGQCAPFPALRKIADDRGLWIIEDSAQAFGAIQNGRAACTFGDIAITSFYPAKPLGCYGDGGAAFTTDSELANKIRQLANHGSRERYYHEVIGCNSRLDAIQAAVLRVKLRHFQSELKSREKNARIYDNFFAGINRIQPQTIAAGNTSTYAQYTLIAENRDSLIGLLKKADIPYAIHYPRTLSSQPCFNSDARCPMASDIATKVISLPICPWTDVQKIVETIDPYFSERTR